MQQQNQQRDHNNIAFFTLSRYLTDIAIIKIHIMHNLTGAMHKRALSDFRRARLRMQSAATAGTPCSTPMNGSIFFEMNWL